MKAQTRAQAKAQTKSEFRLRNRTAFVDENGDGISDLAKDADGDGIPNCQDPDWVKPGDGSGAQARKGSGNGQPPPRRRRGMLTSSPVTTTATAFPTVRTRTGSSPKTAPAIWASTRSGRRVRPG